MSDVAREEFSVGIYSSLSKNSLRFCTATAHV